MPDIPLPEDLSTYIRGMESRIRALETAPRAQDTTQPWQFAEINATFTTSSTVDVDSTPTAGPTITIDVTQTGRVLVSAGAYIGLTLTSQTAGAQLYIDGVAYTSIAGLSNASSQIAANVFSSRVITGLTAGPHTFLLKYRSTGGNVNFSSRSLIVQTF
jgi:hypothetical protein